jgi:hypothetical protein
MTDEQVARVIFCAVNDLDPVHNAPQIDAAFAGRPHCDGPWISVKNAKTAATAVNAARATDATDGATGGGEVDDENAPLRNLPTSNGIRPLRRVATTPVGDLLEQAAIVELVEMMEAAEPYDGGLVWDHTPEEVGLHVMENRDAFLRALKPAGDGGEA